MPIASSLMAMAIAGDVFRPAPRFETHDCSRYGEVIPDP
jgi:hypothetical protein